MKNILLVLFCALFITACGGDEIAEERPQTGNIVAFGASITEGFGVQTGEGYVDVLQQKLEAKGYDYKVINQGISGHTTTQGLARVDKVLDEEPEIVILALGGNDFLRATPLTTVEKNLRDLITQIKTTKADILLVGVTAPPTKGIRYTLDARKVFQNVAEDFDLALIPNYLKGLALDQRYMLPDGIHPNPAGHQKLAENMWPILEPLLRK